VRVLYFDIDSLRPDHLGCYGYHRNTSPNIDRLAAQGVRFNNCHAPDVPCLPSRTALFSGRFGIHTGVINHGGVAADPFIEGPDRGFTSTLGRSSWPWCLRQAGMRTATVSPFGERHSAWHWYAGFNDICNTGRRGSESAEEVSPAAIDWIRRHAKSENWFLHVNFWDPHTPYRAPESAGNPFRDEPTPAWLSEEVRCRHWRGAGPHSAQEVLGFADESEAARKHPRQPAVMDSMDKVRMMFDGYDTGVRHADEHVGRVLNALADQGVLDDTLIIVSSDHGENLGELNIYGDHQTADQITTRIPLIVRRAGEKAPGRVNNALHYSLDLAATTVELAGRTVPENWDGRSFASSLAAGTDGGRPYLVVSQGAWSCQRSVRWDDWICIRSYHDGLHNFPDVMLFNLKDDPHEQNDLAERRPDLVAAAMRMLDEWVGEQMRTATHGQDPMWTVIREGGPLHCRRQLGPYLERLRATGRADQAAIMERKHRR